MNPIVGIGELLWDVFPDGRKVAGGAPFNFAFHCRQLGHEAVIVSRVGDDDLGRELRDEVKRLGLSDEFIQTDRDHPTGTVQVSVDAQGQPTYTITENVAWDFIEWDDKTKRLAETCHCICFGTLAQRGSVSRATIRQYIRPRPNFPLRVFDVNLRKPFADLDLARDCFPSTDWLKVNLDEMNQLIGEHAWDSRTESLFEYFPNCNFQLGILTRGQWGVELDGVGRRFSIPAVQVKVVDTVGAGDAFTAAMVCLHLEGQPLRKCARFANHYAARVCEHQGGTPRIDRAEVERAAFE